MSSGLLKLVAFICLIAGLSCGGLSGLDADHLARVRPTSPDLSRGYTHRLKTVSAVVYVSEDEYTRTMLFLLGMVVCGMTAAPLIYLAKKREAAAPAD